MRQSAARRARRDPFQIRQPRRGPRRPEFDGSEGDDCRIAAPRRDARALAAWSRRFQSCGSGRRPRPWRRSGASCRERRVRGSARTTRPGPDSRARWSARQAASLAPDCGQRRRHRRSLESGLRFLVARWVRTASATWPLLSSPACTAMPRCDVAPTSRRAACDIGIVKKRRFPSANGGRNRRLVGREPRRWRGSPCRARWRLLDGASRWRMGTSASRATYVVTVCGKARYEATADAWARSDGNLPTGGKEGVVVLDFLRCSSLYPLDRVLGVDARGKVIASSGCGREPP